MWKTLGRPRSAMGSAAGASCAVNQMCCSIHEEVTYTTSGGFLVLAAMSTVLPSSVLPASASLKTCFNNSPSNGKEKKNSLEARGQKARSRRHQRKLVRRRVQQPVPPAPRIRCDALRMKKPLTPPAEASLCLRPCPRCFPPPRFPPLPP